MLAASGSLGVVYYVLAIGGMVAGGLAFLWANVRNNLSDKTIDLLRTNNDAQEARITELEREMTECVTDKAALTTRVQMLETLVTNKAEIDKIQEAIDRGAERFDAIDDQLGAVLRAVGPTRGPRRPT